MANENVLQSYLASIGYQIDEDAYRKFKANLVDTGKRVVELGEKFEKLAVVAAGVATELTASVLKIAGTMDRLYFATQRTGSSAKNIQALEYGAQQIGVAAETARASVEGMASALRMNPGLIGLLKSMNINPDKDKVEVLIDLVDRLRRMPFYQGAQYASMFGLDPQTLFMMEKNFDQLKKAMEDNKKVNPIDDEKVKRFHDFMEKVRELTNKLEILANVAGARLLPVAEEIVNLLNQTADALILADKATSGWSTTLLSLAASVISVVGGLKLLKSIASVLGIGGAAEAAGGAGAAAGAGGIGAMLLKSGPLAAGVLGGLLARWGINIKADEYNTRAGADQASVAGSNKQAEAFMSQYQQATGKKASDNWLAYVAWLKTTGRTATPGGGIVGASGGTGLANTSSLHNPGNLRSWGSTPTVAVGKIGKFAKFNSDLEGLSAMAGNLMAYSRRGVNNVRDIVSQWAPRSENDTASYIKDVTQRLGVNEGQGLNLKDPTTMQNLMSAMVHHEQGRDMNPDLIAEAVTYRLTKEGALAPGQGTGAGAQVTLHQTTKIDVHGSGDPKKAADRVLEGQKDTNAEIVRNMTGVVR
jgi:hypothetical protein